MGKTLENVNVILNDLRSRLRAGGLTELVNLKELKEQDLESTGKAFDSRFFLWDSGTYQLLMLEKNIPLTRRR